MPHHGTDISVCAAPFMLGENGHFAVTDGSFVWTVIVTEEAMMATASPPEASQKRIREYVRMYVAIARALLAARNAADGKIWIFEKDVVAFRGQRHRRSLRRFGRSLPTVTSRGGMSRGYDRQ